MREESGGPPRHPALASRAIKGMLMTVMNPTKARCRHEQSTLARTFSAGLTLGSCLCLVLGAGSCSNPPSGAGSSPRAASSQPTTTGIPTEARAAARTPQIAQHQALAQPDSPAYPRLLTIAGGVNHVEQEPADQRLRLEWVRQEDATANGTDAVFRASNPGTRSVLVWNVRLEVRVSGPGDPKATSWEMRENDYPGRGWEHATIDPGQSVQFPMLSPVDDEWRVCLLYSRETPGSQPPNRRFDKTYEAIGPVVRDNPRQ